MRGRVTWHSSFTAKHIGSKEVLKGNGLPRRSGTFPVESSDPAYAYNPDPDTSNPAALELGGKYAAKELIVTDCLFYANFGGGLMNIEKVQTKVTVKNNDFVGNGLLHGSIECGAGRPSQRVKTTG